MCLTIIGLSAFGENITGLNLISNCLTFQAGIDAITGKDLYFECWHSGRPLVMIDARPAESYAKFHIMGTVSVPYTEADKEDFTTIPKDRQVFVLG
jgi:hypothetical protein